MHRVLIVEDDQLVLLDMKRILEANGYNVIGTASKGSSAIKAVKEFDPDIILMDVELEDDVDGIQAAETLTLISEVPVVFVTAFADEETIDRIRNTNASAYLMKPYDEKEFLFTIETSIRRSTAFKEARSQARWFTTILQNIDDGVFVLDNQDIIIFANPLAEKIFHLPNSLGNDYQKIIEGLKPLPDKDMTFETGFDDYSHIQISETVVSGLLNATKEKIVLIRDVSKQYRYEENLHLSVQMAEEASKAKSAFLANMSHELRTPLNSIIGMAELAQDIAYEPPLSEYLSILRNAANSLLFLINGILDFSKIEAGKMTVNISSLKLRNVIEEIVGNLAVQAHSKGLDIYLHYEPETAEILETDEKKIRQILVNIIGNAIKFTVQGNVSIEVCEKDKQLLIAISDTGVGIDKEKQNSIFDPFVQADGSATRNFGGTGLGLAITARLVELLGGRIQLDSTEGMGSKFSIFLPLENAAYDDHSDLSFNSAFNIVLYKLSDDQLYTMKLLLRTLNIAYQIENENIDRYEQDTVILYNGSAELDEAVKNYPYIIRIQKMEKKAHTVGDRILTEPITLENLKRTLGKLSDASLNKKEQDSPIRTSDPKRILLVEDDKINLLVNSRMLEKIGHKVITAENGEIAISRLKKYPIDIVLMDLRMPVLDGIQSTVKIRSGDYSFKNIPIIALTAHALDADKDRALASGMNSFLSKPFSPRSLMEAIDTLNGVQHDEDDSSFSFDLFRNDLIEFLNSNNWIGLQQYIQKIRNTEMKDAPDLSTYLFRMILASRRKERETIINILSDIDEVYQLYLRR